LLLSQPTSKVNLHLLLLFLNKILVLRDFPKLQNISKESER
jgi:hypothetical protein